MSRQLPDRLRRHCVRPGQVRNPTGKNQFSYRRDFEATIQRLAEGKYDPRVQENSDDTAKCWYCQLPDCEKLAASLGAVHDECLERVREMTGGELLAHVGFQKAISGDEKYWSEYAARFWPVLEKRELALSGNLERQEPPDVDDTDELVARSVEMLAALAEPVDD